MNLVRLGHYFMPTVAEEAIGSCRTALVVGVNDDTNVNLAIWNHTGGSEVRTSVVVEAPAPGHESFHLSTDCPWKR